MNPKPLSSSGFALKDGVILLLLVIIAAQGYWLWRPDPQKVPETAGGPPQKALGKIAVIVDDSGYNIQDCHFLSLIPHPLTVAILPELAYSRDIAACARQNGKEVMLHLPLEPHQTAEHYRQGYIITDEMSPAEVAGRFQEALSAVPFAEGINNHMGSKATEDTELMSLVFDQLAAKNLFFIDSRVTVNSICAPLARRKGIPFAERDVFLDNRNERTYIEGQFRELAREAKEKGQAIGIGHARTLTWQIIKEQTEKLTNEGFQIVPVEELVK